MSKTFEQGKDEVAKLCQYFATNLQSFHAPGVKEEHVRQSLIDPFFEALGWDVRNAAMTFMARNRRKTVAYAGDMTDLDALDLPQGEDAAPDPEQELIAHEDGERLRQAIASLPSPFLETLVMRDVNGLSYREIAEATETPVGTVMSRLARARAMLAKTLRAEA